MVELKGNAVRVEDFIAFLSKYLEEQEIKLCIDSADEYCKIDYMWDNKVKTITIKVSKSELGNIGSIIIEEDNGDYVAITKIKFAMQEGFVYYKVEDDVE